MNLKISSQSDTVTGLGLQPALGLQLYYKKKLWHRCFPVNFVKFQRTLSFTEHLWATTSGSTLFL